MGEASIRRSDGAILVFDAATSIVFVSSASVTEHPVEDGAAVSDHVQPQARRISVEGVVTESPWDYMTLDPASTVTVGLDGAARAQAAREFLDGLVENAEVVDFISSRRGTFSTCVVERWSEAITTSANLTATIEIRQIRIAEAGLVVIPPLSTDAAGMGDAADVGTQPTASATDEAAAADTSILASIFGGL